MLEDAIRLNIETIEDKIDLAEMFLDDSIPAEILYNILANEDGTYVCDEEDGETLMEL